MGTLVALDGTPDLSAGLQVALVVSPYVPCRSTAKSDGAAHRWWFCYTSGV